MIKLQRVIGLPVLDARTGNQAGKVLDIWFDEHWTLAGLVLQAKRWWLSTYYIGVLWKQVRVCGEDAVFIAGRDAIGRFKAADIGRAFHTGLVHLRGLPVLTDLGRQLGRVSDVYFHGVEGTPIVGFELTDGFVSDLIEGRKWLKAPADLSEVTLGEDAIVVPARCEEDLEKIVTESGK